MDVYSDIKLEQIPSRAKVGYLSAEVAGEGLGVVLTDGEEVGWSPPPAKPVFPDYSGIKSIRKYFNQTGHQAWPAVLYHPIDAPKTVRNQQEANALGVMFREATEEERSRYGISSTWDWIDGSPWGKAWRSKPYPKDLKFNPMNPGTGKTYVPPQRNDAVAQNSMIEALIPQVAAAVAAAMKPTGPGAPPSVDPGQWNEFIAFQAWKKSQEAVNDVVGEPRVAVETASEAAPSALTTGADRERETWIAEAEKVGAKIDKRWTLDKIMQAVEQATSA